MIERTSPALTRRRVLTSALGAIGGAALAGPALGQIFYQRIPLQYIAALADPGATSGTGAETWGLWRVDPGPIGVPLRHYDALVEAGNRGPGGWQFDPNDWWLDENGILMKAPSFPMPATQLYITNGEGSFSLLTVEAPDAEGRQAWSLSRDQTIADVTHGPCRAGRYTPIDAAKGCSPADVDQSLFPLPIGDASPDVAGCERVQYAVLIVFGIPADAPS